MAAPEMPPLLSVTDRFNALQGEAAVAEGKAETLRRSGMPVPDTHEQAISGLNGEIERLSPEAQAAGLTTEPLTDGEVASHDNTMTGNNNAAYAQIFGEDAPESNALLNPREAKMQARADKARGVSARAVMDKFEETGLLGTRGFGVLLEEFQDLHANSAMLEERARRDPSPENKAAARDARNTVKDWANRLQKAKGVPAQMFLNLQEMMPNPDYKTMTGIELAMNDPRIRNGELGVGAPRDLRPDEVPKFQKIVDRNSAAEQNFQQAVAEVDAEVKRRAPRSIKINNEVGLREFVQNIWKEKFPCPL
jgi:hypothetical protein